jgi:hypothetical protein
MSTTSAQIVPGDVQRDFIVDLKNEYNADFQSRRIEYCFVATVPKDMHTPQAPS